MSKEKTKEPKRWYLVSKDWGVTNVGHYHARSEEKAIQKARDAGHARAHWAVPHDPSAQPVPVSKTNYNDIPYGRYGMTGERVKEVMENLGARDVSLQEEKDRLTIMFGGYE